MGAGQRGNLPLWIFEVSERSERKEECWMGRRGTLSHHPPLHPPPSQYIHPLSNEVLKVLQSRPEFLAKHDLTQLSVLKDGSISVTSNSIPHNKMNIFTTYKSQYAMAFPQVDLFFDLFYDLSKYIHQ